jgi:hypothetical protein
MGHTHLDGAHTHGSGGNFDWLPEAILAAGLVVLAVNVVMWVLGILVVVAEGLGFVIMAAAGIFGTVKWRQLKARRETHRQMIAMGYPPPGYQPVQAPGYWSPGRPADRAALPPAGGDVHLHLPPGTTADDVAAIMRRREAGQ